MTIITISGTPGSGKTTIAYLLEQKTKLRYIYSGDIFRKMAKEHNMSLGQFGEYAEKNREIDEKIDDYQLQELKKGNIILDGRISGWIAYKNKIPSFKIMIQADIDTRAKRIVKRENGDIEKRKKEIKIREKSEAARYKKYYNIDIKDTSIYDVVIDSSDKTPEQIIDIIMNKLVKCN